MYAERQDLRFCLFFCAALVTLGCGTGLLYTNRYKKNAIKMCIRDSLESYLDDYVDEYEREDTQRYDIRRSERTVVPQKKKKKMKAQADAVRRK